MGDLLGSIFGDIWGANEQAKYDQQASQQALTGFNWLSGNPQFQSYLTQGSNANDMIAGLLGTGGDPAKSQAAFQNYLNSTGYKFQLQQGTQAISGNAASRGLLNSGASAKALTQYGQNLGAGYFNNYLGQLTGLANRGESAGEAVGQAGTTGGGNAAGYTQGIGQAWSQGVNNAIGSVGNAAGNFLGMFI